MIVCPVCEHQQAQSIECEVCGKKLSSRATPELPVEQVPGLELTQLEVPAAPVAVQLLPELEQTHHTRGPDLPLTPVPDLDRAPDKLGDVPVQRLAEVDHHRVQTDPRERTALPEGPLTCRYCRNVQSQGAICDKCGMRLSKYMTTAPSGTPGAGTGGEPPTVHHACGARTYAGANCSSCGVFVPMPA